MALKDRLMDLISYALKLEASDIHFIVKGEVLTIQFRSHNVMRPLYQDIWRSNFFEYLKFISGMDLTNPFLPQSGQFGVDLNGRIVYCRFSVLYNQQLQTGVLRLLNTANMISMDHLSLWQEDLAFFSSLVHARQGLIISCGPTSSGKTTTLHALLHEIAITSQHKVVSLEDPIEIEDHSYLQLQINEARDFTYEKGIEQLLRHDPDVICIGETRDPYTAKMVLRAALTGHLVFTTLHAKNTLECIERLCDLGLSRFDLKNVLTAVMAQRLYVSKERSVCVYEILEKEDLAYVLENNAYPKSFKGLSNKIRQGIEKGYITDAQAKFDLLDFER